jgi:predicted AAA+ superfamily ATPase
MFSIVSRTLSSTVLRVSARFPVLLVTGPRQVGKTTLLEQCAEGGRKSVTLDDLDQRDLARRDPALFLQRHEPPLIIDEVQYAPELFGAIKIAVDKAKKPGQFWLTGSQKFHLMDGITESLAGRVAILDLLGLAQTEIAGRADESWPFLPTNQWIDKAEQYRTQPRNLKEVYRVIWRGGFPQIALDEDMPRDIFYSSYLQTYIQRDVRALARVGDELAFQRFVRAAAARTGQLLNYADLARDVDLDQKTAKTWVSILEASGLVYLLPPWHSNLTKRLVKTPKLYFLDTGLCAYLTQWTSPESLEAGAMSGAILETFVVGELIKSYWHNGRSVNLFFYRDRDGKEIDLLIEQDNKLYPIEIKKTATPSRTAMRSLDVLSRLGRDAGPGAVLCLKESPVPLTPKVSAIPIWFL